MQANTGIGLPVYSTWNPKHQFLFYNCTPCKVGNGSIFRGLWYDADRDPTWDISSLDYLPLDTQWSETRQSLSAFQDHSQPLLLNFWAWFIWRLNMKLLFFVVVFFHSESFHRSVIFFFNNMIKKYQHSDAARQEEPMDITKNWGFSSTTFQTTFIPISVFTACTLQSLMRGNLITCRC